FVIWVSRVKLVMWLIDRLSETRFRAPSNPCRLEMFRFRQSRLVTSSRSVAVKGPVGLSNASRMAAFKPGSGILTVWPEAEVSRLTSATASAHTLSEAVVRLEYIFNRV